MSSYDDIVAASIALSTSTVASAEDYDRQIHQHLTFLRRALSKQELSSFLINEGILDNFDPSKDSITYLLILRLQIKAAKDKADQSHPPELLPTGELWRKIAYFLENFEPVQARYLGHEWRQLVEIFAQTAQDFSQPILATQIIRDAILRLDPSSAVFTSTHLLFARLCLHAKAYTCALPILKRPICHIPASSNAKDLKSLPVLCADHQSSLAFLGEKSGFSSKLSYREYLEYFLYGGMIFMALKEWRSASRFLATVISMPTVLVVSKIMIEAYKKWILVGLLETGKVPSTPSMTPSHTAKTYQTLVKSYISLGEAFERGDLKRFQTELEAGQAEWHADNNAGIVDQVRQALTLHFLKQTKKTFAALTIPELLEQDTPLPNDSAAAESIIASLITSGDLEATLVHSPTKYSGTMLRFSANPSYSRLSHEGDIQKQLKKEKLLLELLMDRIEESNHNLALSDELLDHIKRGQTWSGAGEGNAIQGEGGEIEEDIMVDFP